MKQGQAFQEFSKNIDMLKLLDEFPYMIEIYAPDGALVYSNRDGPGDTGFTGHIRQDSSEILKAKEFMNNNWTEKFNIDMISQASHLSKFYFQRVFKETTGATPFEYYKHLKVEKLKEALRDSNLSIAEAFSSCGANYHGSYYKYFKETVGMTPSEYRKLSL